MESRLYRFSEVLGFWGDKKIKDGDFLKEMRSKYRESLGFKIVMEHMAKELLSRKLKLRCKRRNKAKAEIYIDACKKLAKHLRQSK